MAREGRQVHRLYHFQVSADRLHKCSFYTQHVCGASQSITQLRHPLTGSQKRHVGVGMRRYRSWMGVYALLVGS